MKFIAHRGYITEGVEENTLKAFENAYYDDCFVGFELDVRETKDNEFVVLHDPIINRVSDGSGFISNYKYRDLLIYNFGTNKYPSKLLKLKTVLKKFPEKIIVVELKKIKSIKKITKLLNKYKNVYVASFNSKLLKEIIKLNPKFKVGLFNNIINSEISYQEYDFIGLIQKLAFDKSIIKYFKRRNIELMAFGINDKIITNPKPLKDIYLIIDEKVSSVL